MSNQIRELIHAPVLESFTECFYGREVIGRGSGRVTVRLDLSNGLLDISPIHFVKIFQVEPVKGKLQTSFLPRSSPNPPERLKVL
jgi:hypothetical protein